MQVGFMLVETGFVRERSMSGIALKTFLKLLASSLAYSLFGYRIMYGPDLFGGFLGWGLAAGVATTPAASLARLRPSRGVFVGSEVLALHESRNTATDRCAPFASGADQRVRRAAGRRILE